MAFEQWGIMTRPSRRVVGLINVAPSLPSFSTYCLTVDHEWLRLLEEDGDYQEEEITTYMATFLAIFSVNDAYLLSRDAGFLEH